MLILQTSITFFMVFKHPLILVMTLILQTTSVMFFLFNNMNDTWIMFILFLIFLGGLLVIFIYLSALIPNELFFSNKINMMWILSPLFFHFALKEMTTPMNINFLLKLSSFQSTNMILLFMSFIMFMLCMIMFMCLTLKTPIKQESY